MSTLQKNMVHNQRWTSNALSIQCCALEIDDLNVDPNCGHLTSKLNTPRHYFSTIFSFIRNKILNRLVLWLCFLETAEAVGVSGGAGGVHQR